MNKERKNSYYRRLQYSFILLIILPTFVLTILTYTINKENLIEKVKLSNEVILNSVADDINQAIDDIVFTSHMIVQDEDVNETLEYFSESESISSYEGYLAFKKLKKIYSITEMRTLNQEVSIFLINNQEFIIPSFRNQYAINVLQQHWNQIIEKIDINQGISLQWIGQVDNNDEKNSSEFYFSRVITKSSTNKPIGALNLSIPNNKLEKLFEQMIMGELALYDNKNQLIYGNDLLKQDIKNAISSERTISQFNWRLVHIAPESEYTLGLRSSLFNSIVILSFFVLIFLLISLIMARKMHDPIENLQKVTTEFGAGNMDVRFTDTGYSETNELGKAINNMFEQINDLIINIKKEQELKKELEMDALYSQIHPHFLINTLNSIRVNLHLQGDHYHSEKIKSLTLLLRRYLKSTETVSLIYECELLEYYVDIMNMRNDKEIHLDLVIDDNVADFKLPFLLLQPIVENSILHGLKDEESGTIMINAFTKSGDVVIQVIDDGKGMSQQKCDQLNHRLSEIKKDDELNLTSNHIGLRNIYQRLYLNYGELVSFMMESEYGFGTMAEIRIKLDDAGDKNV